MTSFVYFLVMKNFRKKILSLGLAAFWGLGLTACVYEPEKYEPAESGDEPSEAPSAKGGVYRINWTNKIGLQQICNPSVSQDTVNYPASMLWLNFPGLGLTTSDSGFSFSDVEQHDRLTVSDTANKVLWYLMRDLEAGECQFQDPEWSTHPNYIVALRAYDYETGKACDEMTLDYGIFAVRMSDKKKFWFFEKNISQFATPHLWVDPSATETSGADTTISGFFGTDNVRLVFVDTLDNINFVDYAKSSKPIKLKKPADVSDWMMDSPLISPDGNYIVFNAINSSSTSWNSYFQELKDGSEPVLIEKVKGAISNPVQPHWFKYGNRLFVVWAEFPSGSSIVNKADLGEASAQDGSAGRTVMREISLMSGAPADLAYEWVGDAREIAPVPMIGGRSPDGHFLSTGNKYGFMYKLP